MTLKQLVLAGSENMHSAQKTCYVGANEPVNVTGQRVTLQETLMIPEGVAQSLH